MKSLLFLIILTAVLMSAVPLNAQEQLPDTVWSKQIQNAHVVKFSPDGQYVFVGIRYDVLKIETTTGNVIDTFALNRPLMKSLSPSPTGDTLIITGNRLIMMWNVITGDTIFTLNYGEEACFTPDGKRIIATTGKMGLDEPQILVIDIETKEIIKTFIGRYNYTGDLQISSDGKYFSFTDFRGTYSTVILIDLNTYEEIKIFENPNGSLDKNIFSPNNKYLAANSAGHKDIFIWDLKTLELFKHFQYEEFNDITIPILTNEKFTMNSKYLIMSFFDNEDFDPNKIIVWNIEGDSLEYEYSFSGSTALDVSKDDYIAGYSRAWRILSLLRPKWNGTGVKEHKKEDFKYTYNNEKLKIHFDDIPINIPEINIYNMIGMNVGANCPDCIGMPLQTQGNIIEIDIGYLTAGVYFVIVDVSGKRYVIKLMR
ncbi:WD40 repeat domain-containing protein [Bacteroidota bacterium]